MIWNRYSALEGEHAFLGASKYHWINYDEEKLRIAYGRHRAAEKGTRLHSFAAEAIALGIRLAKSRKTLYAYVNDAIGFRMQPEQVLYYSDNAFGTADAISFEQNFLRIHDLKNGVSKPSFNQLRVYAAFFCLEYRVNPEDIGMELRIYHQDDVMMEEPDPGEIRRIMHTVIAHDRQIEKMKAGL